MIFAGYAATLAGCAALAPAPVTPHTAVALPAPPKFMGACAPSSVKPGDMPNAAFDSEHAAFKECARAAAASRVWYVKVRTRYGGAVLPTK